MPFFSICVPTRNRATMVTESAIQSVLDQTFTDFEIVVCDNASTDDTQQQVEAIDDPRVRYVGAPNHIPKENFLEWSLTQARGNFSLMFCDDDVLVPDALERAHAILTHHDTDFLVFLRECPYYFQDWHENDLKNTLVIAPYTGRVYNKSTSRHLERFFEKLDLLRETPMNTNAFYRTSYIVGLIKHYGSIYPHGHMGDYNMACHVLSHTDEFLYVDAPLAIFGQWHQNTTEQLHDLQTTMPEYQEWVDWARTDLLAQMPVKAYLWPNCVAAALIDMKQKLNIPFSVKSACYFITMQAEIARLESKGIDVSEAHREFTAVFSQQPADLQENIRQMTRHGRLIRDDDDDCEVTIPNLPGDRSAICIRTQHPIFLKGSQNGFNDILQCRNTFAHFSWTAYTTAPTTTAESTKTASTGTSSHDLVHGLHAYLKNQYDRIVLVGTDILAKACAHVLTGDIVHVVDPRVSLRGATFSNGLPIENLETLDTGDYDCVLVAYDGCPTSLTQAVKSRVNNGRCSAATVVTVADIMTRQG